MSRWVALIAVVMAAAFPAKGQPPDPVPPAIPSVPTPSAAATETRVIGVVDAEGLPVAGAVVEVNPIGVGETLTLMTNEEGSVVITSIPPGIYEIAVRLEGFSVASQMMMIDPQQPPTTNFVTIELAGPVPGAIERGGARSPSVEVVRLATSDELAVQSLLAEREQQDWDFSSALPQPDGGTFFVFYKRADPRSCLTQVVEGQLGGDALQRRLGLVRNLRLYGAHRLTEHRWALVLCDG